MKKKTREAVPDSKQSDKKATWSPRIEKWHCQVLEGCCWVHVVLVGGQTQQVCSTCINNATQVRNFIIFPSTSHMAMIFTYLEMCLSPLLSYIYSILLCYCPLMKFPTCVALLMWALQTCCVHPPTNTTWTQQHPANTWQCHFSILGDHVAFLSLCLLSGTASLVFFFIVLWTHDNS